jgi:dynein light intermediate chain
MGSEFGGARGGGEGRRGVRREVQDSQGRVWRLKPSTVQPTREDAVRTAQRVADALERFGARPEPLCAVRERIFAEAFDEMVRQVLLLEPARGLLLLRVRDERRLTVQAYASLAQGGVRYSEAEGMGAGAPEDESDAELTALIRRAQALQESVSRLRTRRLRLEAELEAIARDSSARKKREEAEWAADADRWNRQIRVLQTVIGSGKRDANYSLDATPAPASALQSTVALPLP